MDTAQKQTTFDDVFGDGISEEEAEAKRAEKEAQLVGARQARDDFAQEVGGDASDIGLVLEDMALRLMEGGVVVSVHIHRWTGLKRLSPKELGLNGRKTKSKAIILGEKLMMPPTILRCINSLSTQIRSNLEHYSFRTVWGRWISAPAYLLWKNRHDELTEQYMEVGRSLADNMEAILTGESGTWGELRRLYAEHARVVWCRTNQYEVTEPHMNLCPSWYVDEYVDGIFAHMPAADEIRDSFNVEARISYIPLPSMLEVDATKKRRVWEQAADERAQDQRRIAAEEAMNADVRSHYLTEKKTMIDEYLAGLAGQVHGKIYDVTSRTLATMGKNKGQLLEPSLRMLRHLVAWGENMNPMDDQELATSLDDLRALISRSAEDRSPADIKEQLEAMGTVARSVLLDLNMVPHIEDGKLSVADRDAVLGIGRRLSRAKVASAREALGTDGIKELPIVTARRGTRGAVYQTVPQI